MYYACGCSLEWKGHAGVRRGRNTLYVRLFMPCIFKMSQKSFITFCVKDHQLVKSRLGNSQWEQVCGCLLELKGRAGPRGQKRQIHAIVYALYIYNIHIWHRNNRPCIMYIILQVFICLCCIWHIRRILQGLYKVYICKSAYALYCWAFQ